MGAVNYGTSDYITMAYNCNTEYAPDDFGTMKTNNGNLKFPFA